MGRGYDVAEVAAREQVRVAGGESGAGCGRAVAAGGWRAVADCVESGCGLEVRVAMEERLLAGGKDVWGGCVMWLVAGGEWWWRRCC